METKRFRAENGAIITYYVSEAVSPKGIVQISHGLAEHALRYSDFMRFLNENGYTAAAEDHRAHGATAGGKPGLSGLSCYEDTVKDMHSLTLILKEQYPYLPVMLLGHSYGSFLAQRYIELYGGEVAAAVLSGTRLLKGFDIRAGRVISLVQSALMGNEKAGKLIYNMAFGGYDKPFKKENLRYAWISRDKETVKKYAGDPLCGFAMSIGFYRSFFKGLLKTSASSQTGKIRKDLPVLIACGSKDPVSGYSNLAVKLKKTYEKAGLKPEIKIYEGARHEILNETNKAEVYQGILAFFNKNLKTI